MTANEAFEKVREFVGENVVLSSAREYLNDYGFFIAPPGTDVSKKHFVGGQMFVVSKKDGHVYTSDDDEFNLTGKPWTTVKSKAAKFTAKNFLSKTARR